MGISIKDYAAHRGCSRMAVYKAVNDGRISREPDGTIDPVAADAHWNDGIIPPMPGRIGGAVRGKKHGANTRAVPVEAVESVEDTLREEGQEVSGDMTFIQARLANEILKAQERKLKLEKMRGELIDRNKTMAMVFGLARQERDAWINWPVRVAALMANDVGADVHAVQIALDRYVRSHLAEMAEIEVPL